MDCEHENVTLDIDSAYGPDADLALYGMCDDCGEAVWVRYSENPGPWETVE